MRKTFLYRAVALETRLDEFTDEPVTWPGATLGRATGYLSRSSAVEAGEAFGVEFVVVRSEPVVFPVPREVALAREVDELKEQLAAVLS